MKKTILVFIGYFLPGYKSGGPVRTISNMLDLLGNEFNFLIITRDRDQLDNKPYENIKVNEWNDGPNCKIFYLSKNNLQISSYKLLISLINNLDFDQYYLNSLFDVNFSTKIVLLRKLKLVKQKPLLLAPRGELGSGALSLKSFKKSLFLKFVNRFGLYKNIVWHASSDYEAKDINKQFGENVKVKIAMDIPNYKLRTDFERTHKKEKGKLKILFISNIGRMKNLKFAIEVLNKVEGNFTFDIYGAIKDKEYWQECLNAIEDCNKEKINYKGSVPNDQIHTIYPNYDLFFLPTLGENFGHVIYESLFFSVPVLTSDKTPWDKLNEFNVGFYLSLAIPEAFISKIGELIKLNNNEYQNLVFGCKKHINSLYKNGIKSANQNLFHPFN